MDTRVYKMEFWIGMVISISQNCPNLIGLQIDLPNQLAVHQFLSLFHLYAFQLEWVALAENNLSCMYKFALQSLNLDR